MRRPLFIFMILLLLLRGWVGDAMATTMASAKLQSTQIASEMIATGSHCVDHVADQAFESVGQDGTGHGGSCGFCAACHAVGLSPLFVDTACVAIPLALPHAPSAQFASAMAALGQKPPIS
ncbi:MAG: hypothetical protein IV109_10320 [Rhodoferax sp.]|nr:hypothetical protein [Rhodoferax sp.]